MVQKQTGFIITWCMKFWQIEDGPENFFFIQNNLRITTILP